MELYGIRVSNVKKKTKQLGKLFFCYGISFIHWVSAQAMVSDGGCVYFALRTIQITAINV